MVRVGYAELLRDPAAVLARVAPFAGDEAIAAACSRALAADIPTKNRVVEGRGQELPPEARTQLERLTGYYAGHDLGPSGSEGRRRASSTRERTPSFA